MRAPELESKRLYYEPLGTTHLSNEYVDWMNDSEVNKYLESGGDYTIEKLEDFLKLCLELTPIANQGLMNPAEMRGRLWRHLF